MNQAPSRGPTVMSPELKRSQQWGAKVSREAKVQWMWIHSSVRHHDQDDGVVFIQFPKLRRAENCPNQKDMKKRLNKLINILLYAYFCVPVRWCLAKECINKSMNE